MERTGNAMRLQRIADPGSIDVGLIARSIANGAHRVVLQFSKESAYSPSILEDVNLACRTVGVKVNVRFWAHYGSQLAFVGRLHGLSALTLLLGGRNNLEQLAHDGIKHLEVLRVRGMNTIDLALFPKIEDLRVEDQVQLQNLNLDGGPNLRAVSIWNCKTFSELQGMRHAHRLESLFVGKTAIEPDAFLRELPANLKQLSLTGYRKRKDDGLRNRIDSLGYASAKYMEDIYP